MIIDEIRTVRTVHKQKQSWNKKQHRTHRALPIIIQVRPSGWITNASTVINVNNVKAGGGQT
jgi:hypothetical protein